MATGESVPHDVEALLSCIGTSSTRAYGRSSGNLYCLRSRKSSWFLPILFTGSATAKESSIHGGGRHPGNVYLCRTSWFIVQPTNGQPTRTMPLIIDTSSFRGNAIVVVPFLSSLSLFQGLCKRGRIRNGTSVSKICNKSASYLIDSNFNFLVEKFSTNRRF